MGARETYTQTGPGHFGDAELIALVLGTGAGGQTSGAIAAALVDRFGGLAGLAKANAAELAEIDGVGPARAVRISAALEMGRRSLRPRLDPGRPVRTPREAWEALSPALLGLADEELHALYLDRRRRPVAQRVLTRGSDAFTIVDPRQVFRPAVALGAVAVILAHNHPSGDPTPSTQDRDITKRVAGAGKVLGIALLDHLVVGAGAWTSLAEDGCLPDWNDPTTGFTADR